MIQLVGPGGAGKSTAGAVLAARLGEPFVDLDLRFAEQMGDIDHFIGSRGYSAYARANVEVYRSIRGDDCDGVLALSSGFMTYALGVHTSYAAIRSAVALSPLTFVLLPSLDRETCVAETVRRQLARPFTRGAAAREEAVIRERFEVYLALPARKIATMRPPSEVAAEIAARSNSGPAGIARRPRRAGASTWP